MNPKDLLAKLLANENLNVIRANVQTASFLVEKRTLTLPLWKDMTVEIEDMLIGHEVGHALYTVYDSLNKEEYMEVFDYMNVIEDVRIEKLIKLQYPGLRKSFIQGYKQLNDKDFFGILQHDLTTLLLIDRINLYYKVGINCGVTFTKEEMNFVRRVDYCKTVEDVFQLAKEIYDFSKDEREQKQKEHEEQKSEDEEGGEDIDTDEDWDSEYSNQNNPASPSYSNKPSRYDEQSEKEDLTSKTQRSFKERLASLADINCTIYNCEPKISSNRDPIVPYKTIISELTIAKENYLSAHAPDWSCHPNLSDEDFKKFKDDSVKVVSHLVKEFEMKKSAAEYKRTETYHSGSLNVNKLHAYKLSKDIFNKVEIIPEDKNHGMIFLLDWSGSMNGVIRDTVKQVINLAMFCHRIQIPYQVFAFTSDYIRHRLIDSSNDVNGFKDSGFVLLEFFNNKMSKSEFDSMTKLLLDSPWRFEHRYGLGGTPLNESLVYLADYIGTFIKNSSIEKMSLITLTDGEATQLDFSDTNIGWINRGGKSSKVFLRDPMTKREYPLPRYGNEQTHVLLKLIKDRYPIKIVGFHILPNNRKEFDKFVGNNLLQMDHIDRYNVVDNLIIQVRQHNYAIVPNTARDILFILSASKQKIDDSELLINPTMNSRQISKQLCKYFNVKKNSRVILTRFIDTIS